MYFVSGYAPIAWLLRYLAAHTPEVLVAYRIPLGVVVLVLAAAGAIG
jgi:undecaprenyl-diphosphatase